MSTLTREQFQEVSAKTLDLCTKAAKMFAANAIDFMLTETEAAALAALTKAGAPVLVEIQITGGVPCARLVARTADGQSIELATIRGATLQ